MLGDKTKYIEHIKDKEQHIAMRKILDRAESVLKYHETRHTDFLDPYQRELAYSILNRIDVSYTSIGGLKDAERKSIVIFPEYMTIDNIDNPIKAIKIKGNFKFNSLSHRDYLGSILGLGIVREKIGDINVSEQFASVIVHIEVLDFIIYNLKNIGKEAIELVEIDLSQVEKPIEDFEEKRLTITSLRLDSLISATHNLSRNKSAVMINQGKVKVNWRIIENISHEIKEGDMVSIRKFGRIKVTEGLGASKKGKEIIGVRVYK